MNNRQRFWKMVNFEELDHLPFWADWLGPWRTWKKQGLPVGEDMSDEKFRDWCLGHFGFEGMYSVFWGVPRLPVEIGPYPPFETLVLEEKEDYKLVRQGNGVIVQQFSQVDGSLYSTHFVDYPIKNRADWIRYRDEHLDPDAAGRYPAPEPWEALKKELKGREYIISVDGGSFYGFLRDWIGFEKLSYMLFDDPRLVHEMMDYLADYFVAILHKAVHEVDIDFAMFWEDMCYKSGPLLSPAMFRDFMLPGYKKVTSFLVEHGVELSWVDCDGNIEALIPCWLEGGVRGFYPLEVASDMDAAKLRQKYGRQIVMWGNVDKRALAQGKPAIDAEIARLAPVVAQGGFIPLVDHGVPDDVSYQNYLYYLEQRKRITGYK